MGFMKKLLLATIFSLNLIAADIPGGQMRVAEQSSPYTYELLLAPSISFPGLAYLNSEIRYQASEEIGVGFGFGSGELGFNFGPNMVWNVIPDTSTQPAFALAGGIYLNRVMGQNFFVVKINPMISKVIRIDAEKIIPYAGLSFSPSFALTMPQTQFGIKTTIGTQLEFSGMGGMRLWAEFGLGVVNSFHEIVIGLSYPFRAL
jgi:hypothetical protein